MWAMPVNELIICILGPQGQLLATMTTHLAAGIPSVIKCPMNTRWQQMNGHVRAAASRTTPDSNDQSIHAGRH